MAFLGRRGYKSNYSRNLVCYGTNSVCYGTNPVYYSTNPIAIRSVKVQTRQRFNSVSFDLLRFPVPPERGIRFIFS